MRDYSNEAWACAVTKTKKIIPGNPQYRGIKYPFLCDQWPYGTSSGCVEDTGLSCSASRVVLGGCPDRICNWEREERSCMGTEVEMACEQWMAERKWDGIWLNPDA